MSLRSSGLPWLADGLHAVQYVFERARDVPPPFRIGDLAERFDKPRAFRGAYEIDQGLRRAVFKTCQSRGAFEYERDRDFQQAANRM
jgi:hypothetical protein